MMMKRYIGAAVVALSLVTTSTAFAAAPVRPASTLPAATAGVQRASTQVKDSNQLIGLPFLTILLGVAGAAAAIAAVAAIANNDSPTSP